MTQSPKSPLEALIEECEQAQAKSTKVVAWHAHGYDGTVRGPYRRWFTCTGGHSGTGDEVNNPAPVSPIGDDVEFAAKAMNSQQKLIAALKIARETLEYYSHPDHYKEIQRLCGKRPPGVLVEKGHKAREGLKKMDEACK